MSHTATRSPVAPGSGAMFDGIAKRYDLLNRIISMGLDGRWRRHLVCALGSPERAEVLDVATGTADVAIAVAKAHRQCRVVGLDPSREMLAIGSEKLRRRGYEDRVRLIAGDAQALPFEDDRFAASCISFGIRNVPDRRQGLSEMVRTTRPGGKVAVLELGEPKGRGLGSLARVYVHRVIPWLGGLISGSREYRYLANSVAAFPTPDVFTEMMSEAGLSQVTMRRLAFGAAHLFVGTVP